MLSKALHLNKSIRGLWWSDNELHENVKSSFSERPHHIYGEWHLLSSPTKQQAFLPGSTAGPIPQQGGLDSAGACSLTAN